MILDLFAGPGGWDEGARPLGLHPIGVEWDEQYEQCGNAIPPRLATHLLAEAIGAPVPTFAERRRRAAS